MQKKSSDASTASNNNDSSRLARSFSGNVRSGKSSVLGELLRSAAPPWVEHLVDAGLSKTEEKKLLSASNKCGLCHTLLKGMKELEPSNKKVCRVCKTVVCRQCAAQVHVLGHLRRRHICFKCVGEACTATKLVPPVVVIEKVTVQTASVPEPTPKLSIDEKKEESMLTSFVSRLWDTWSGWNGQSEETISEAEDEGDDSTPISKATKDTEEDGQTKLDRMNELLESTGGKFDGDSLKNLLDVSHGFKGDKTLVLSIPFTKACTEVIKLMAGLGKAFEFAGSDMNDKLRIMDKRTKETAAELKVPSEEVTLQMMIDREIKAKTTHAGKKAGGATRTVVRLLWFLDFISVLLTKLANEPKADLSKILGATYEETLAPRHVWVLRRVVRAGMSMVPDKKVFLPRLGVEKLSESEQCEKFRIWVKSIDAVRGDMWKYIESKALSDVP